MSVEELGVRGSSQHHLTCEVFAMGLRGPMGRRRERERAPSLLGVLRLCPLPILAPSGCSNDPHLDGSRQYWSLVCYQQVTRFAADVNPALPPARGEASEGGPMVSSRSRARATRAHTMASHTSSLVNWGRQVLVGGEESEVGLQLRPSLFRLPEAHADRAAER